MMSRVASDLPTSTGAFPPAGITRSGSFDLTLTNLTATGFRCFRKVEARLAPLTLLVGENGAGKTSFLALARALLDSGYGRQIPDFREPPYDLGTFRDIAHRRGAKGGGASAFSASFEARSKSTGKTHRHEVTFEERAAFAVPSVRRYASGRNAFVEREADFSIETPRGKWTGAYSEIGGPIRRGEAFSIPSWALVDALAAPGEEGNAMRRKSRGGNGPESPPGHAVLKAVSKALRSFAAAWPSERPYCSAPVRTRPLRTYDPLKPAPDPEGENIPTYLAHLSAREKDHWDALRDLLESFGRSAGLFDELRVNRLSGSGGGSFRIQVRKHASGKRGPWRNLVDAGYGVSQSLRFLTELLRRDGAGRFLLQQPEAHLHPRAQAELGSLLCRVAASGRQVIVETHSDHLWDRVRMDVRDGVTDLQPKDVSLLFFEREDLEVRIHSLEFDRTGGVIGAPVGYRQFFLDELDRSISV